MVQNYTQGQEYAQWNPWGQMSPDCQQAQAPWNTQQPGYGWQGQQAWNTQSPWNAQQPGYDGQGTWNTYGQNSVWQEWQDNEEQDAPKAPAVSAAVPEATQPVKSQRSKAVNLVLNILTLCFVVFLIAGSTIFAFSNNETKSLFGYRFYNVLTPSMQPLFRPGDMIFVKLVEPAEIKVGDVVTFNPSATSTAFLTHRVVELLPADEIRPARMVTKGDFNNAEDPPVGLNAAIGVHVFTVPLMGRVIEMMRENLVLVCICLGAIFLLLMVLRAYFAARKAEKKKVAAPVPPPTRQPLDIHAF
ncbi:MAG: signal peptidase I [Firmicutes bacterium]|nr:signal peptidase I [Bacillota bacterium]